MHQLDALDVEAGSPDAIVEPITGRQDRDRFEYKGLSRLLGPDRIPVGWVVVRAQPGR